MNNILTLSGLFSSDISSVILDIIDQTLAAPGNAVADYQDTAANSAWVLGVCMQTLVERDVSEWSDRVDLDLWTRTCLQNWAWSHDVLGGLFALSQAMCVFRFICGKLLTFISQSINQRLGIDTLRRYIS